MGKINKRYLRISDIDFERLLMKLEEIKATIEVFDETLKEYKAVLEALIKLMRKTDGNAPKTPPKGLYKLEYQPSHREHTNR
jgi:hypothetical protein